MGTSSQYPLTLRSLSLPTRLVLSAFLISIGLGYFAALVQLHFAHASAGQLLPGEGETVRNYSGEAGKSQLARLLQADVGKPFNGSGTMRPAFTTQSAGWQATLRNLAVAAAVPLAPISQLEHLLEAPEDQPFNGTGTMRPAFTTRSSGGWSAP